MQRGEKNISWESTLGFEVGCCTCTVSDAVLLTLSLLTRSLKVYSMGCRAHKPACQVSLGGAVRSGTGRGGVCLVIAGAAMA